MTETGHGMLADAVDRALSALGPDAGAALVAATDTWSTGQHDNIRATAAAQGRPWLPVRAELSRVVIGPVETLGVPGCADCAERRRTLARRHPEGNDAVWQRSGPELRRRPAAALTPLAAGVVAALVGDEVRRLATGTPPARTCGALLYVDLHTLRVTRHPFLPDPHCPICADRPADDAAAARPDLRSRPKPSPDVYRVRSLSGELPELLSTYVGEETGLIRGIGRDSQGGVVVAAAALGLSGGAVEYGYGRSRSYAESELVALLEALERHGGMRPAGRRTAVRAAYRDLADRALDPRELGTHAPEAYARADFRFVPFAEDRPLRWVWGWSFRRQEPVLVPESYAYYRLPRVPDEPPPMVYETSNGCALGGCLEEAILHGLLEVAERDAFLMTWYARMSVPRLDPVSARDRAIPLMLASIEAETGYRVLLFDITLEQGIPAVWAMAVDPDEGSTRPGRLCSAGAHPDPERAVGNALAELGPLLAAAIRDHPGQRERAAAMVADADLVRTMDDHSVVNAHPAVAPRFDFLTRSTAVRDLRDVHRPAGMRGADLRTDLDALIGRYIDSDLDVVVVDQTTPEHRAGGFSCVKVIVPGTLSMTFGQRHRRTEGVPRLLRIPHRLGGRDRLLEPGDLNPHPHPFP